MKIAALADIHIRADGHGTFAELCEQVNYQADVFLLCGDVTDEGTIDDARVLYEDLKRVTIPVVMVLGNHDYESGQEKALISMLKSDHVHILDGDSVVINDVGFAGTKGFVGGFGSHLLPNFGEPFLKNIVQEGVSQMLQLEAALSKLETEKKVVLMHYSPIRDTVVGESAEIFPFMGLSRLENPLNQFQVDLVVHGHAHQGTYQGKTKTGIPVFNVAQSLLNRDGKLLSIHEI